MSHGREHVLQNQNGRAIRYPQRSGTTFSSIDLTKTENEEQRLGLALPAEIFGRLDSSTAALPGILHPSAAGSRCLETSAQVPCTCHCLREEMNDHISREMTSHARLAQSQNQKNYSSLTMLLAENHSKLEGNLRARLSKVDGNGHINSMSTSSPLNTIRTNTRDIQIFKCVILRKDQLKYHRTPIVYLCFAGSCHRRLQIDK